MSPYLSRDSWKSFVGPGNSSWLSVDRRCRSSPSACSSVSSPTGCFQVRPSSALVRNGSGQPPGGSPSSPLRKPTTESGMSNFAGLSSNSAGSAPTATRCSARSPTTFELGVTLTTLPRMSLAAAYMSSICSNFSPRPSAIACWRRLDSCPPGISCVYTRPVGDGSPLSNGA